MRIIRTVLLLWVLAATSVAAAEQRNFLLVVSDDLNNDLGCYGHSIVSSPNIDRLAQHGLRFDRAYCQYPLCNPSRASFMTGLYPGQTGVRNNSVHFRENVPQVTTLAQLFQKHGYLTARVGKIYHYGVPGQIGTDGLDDPPSWDQRLNPRGRDKEEEDKIFSLVPGAFGGTLSWLAAEGTDREQTDGIGATQAIGLLEEFAKQDKPFFLAVGFYRPHTPYVAPKNYFQLYPVQRLQLAQVPADDRDDLPAGALQVLSRKPDQHNLAEELARQAIQAYYASITFMDTQLGRLLEALERLGLSERTVVVFTSDHGYHMGEHGWWQKTTLFENAARVPLIIAGPGVKAAGQATDALAELIDLYPTLADLAGWPAPGHLAGKSLRPMLEDASARVRDAALTRLGNSFSIRTERWRYTEWNGGKDGMELYDHQKDPGEFTNLAGKPEYQETLRKLSTLLRERVEAAGRVPAGLR